MSLILLLESSVIFKAELPLNHGRGNAGHLSVPLLYAAHILNSPQYPLKLREIQVGPY